MSHKAPGKTHRKGLTLAQLFHLFPDDQSAQKWFEKQRWGDEPHPTMSYRCREKECRKHFSVRTNSILANTKLGYQQWIIAIYLLTTSLKGVSSMKLHRDLGITQKSAWHLAHRLHKAWDDSEQSLTLFSGPVEVDESCFGGKRKSMSNAKRKELSGSGRGTVGKTAVVGIKDRETNKVRAKVTKYTTREALQGFVHEHSEIGSTVYNR